MIDKVSLRIIKAKTAPKRADEENIVPVLMEPISFKPTIKKRIEKPMLNAPTDIKYGNAESGT